MGVDSDMYKADVWRGINLREKRGIRARSTGRGRPKSWRWQDGRSGGKGPKPSWLEELRF